MPEDPQRTVRREATALWCAVFGQPPAAGMESHEMLATIVEHLEVKDYARFHSADRARDLTWPRYSDSPTPKITSL